MNTHPYLKAYMAASVVPTFFLIFVLTAFLIVRYVFALPVPIERVIIFPMAVVPNLFGLWNVVYLWLGRRHLPIGFHGAVLPFLLVPSGYLLGRTLGVLETGSTGLVYFQEITVPYSFALIGFLCALIIYYLVWKYVVGSFNVILGIA